MVEKAKKRPFVYTVIGFLIWSYLIKLVVDSLTLYFWNVTLVDLVKGIFNS